MTAPLSNINLLKAIRENSANGIGAVRAEIRTAEKKLADLRTHLHALLAIAEAAGVPVDLTENTKAPAVVAADAASSEQETPLGGPALHAA